MLAGLGATWAVRDSRLRSPTAEGQTDFGPVSEAGQFRERSLRSERKLAVLTVIAVVLAGRSLAAISISGESREREANDSDSSPAERSARTVTRGVRAALATVGAAASPARSLTAKGQTKLALPVRPVSFGSAACGANESWPCSRLLRVSSATGNASRRIAHALRGSSPLLLHQGQSLLDRLHYGVCFGLAQDPRSGFGRGRASEDQRLHGLAFAIEVVVPFLLDEVLHQRGNAAGEVGLGLPRFQFVGRRCRICFHVDFQNVS